MRQYLLPLWLRVGDVILMQMDNVLTQLKANGVKIVVALAAALFFLWLWYGGWLTLILNPLLTFTDRVRDDLPSYGPWAPLAYSVLYAGQIVIAPIPGIGLALAGGFLFGALPATIYSLIGILVGGGIAFVIGRRMGWPLIEWLAPKRWLDQWRNLPAISSNFTWFLLMLAPTIDPIYFIAGLTKLSLRRFLLIVTLGRAPGLLISTYLGANGEAFGPQWWIGLVVVLATLAIVGNRLHTRLEKEVAQNAP